MILDWFTGGKPLFYEGLFRKLHMKKIRYLLVGGTAVSLHGAARFTADIDIVVEMSEENIKNFISAMNELGYKPKAPVNPLDFADSSKRKAWIAEKGMKVFAFFNPNNPLELIDVLVDSPINFDEMEKEKSIKKARGIEIPIPSIKHLIELKKIAGRDQDLLDVKKLQEIEKLL